MVASRAGEATSRLKSANTPSARTCAAPPVSPSGGPSSAAGNDSTRPEVLRIAAICSATPIRIACGVWRSVHDADGFALVLRGDLRGECRSAPVTARIHVGPQGDARPGLRRQDRDHAVMGTRCARRGQRAGDRDDLRVRSSRCQARGAGGSRGAARPCVDRFGPAQRRSLRGRAGGSGGEQRGQHSARSGASGLLGRVQGQGLALGISTSRERVARLRSWRRP